VNLVQGRSTWGEYIMRTKAIAEETQRNLAVIGHQVDISLQQAHARELDQRQQNAEAFARQMAVQQQQQQIEQTRSNEELQRSLHNFGQGPVRTDCQQFGTQISCTSHGGPRFYTGIALTVLRRHRCSFV